MDTIALQKQLDEADEKPIRYEKIKYIVFLSFDQVHLFTMLL